MYSLSLSTSSILLAAFQTLTCNITQFKSFGPSYSLSPSFNFSIRAYSDEGNKQIIRSASPFYP